MSVGKDTIDTMENLLEQIRRSYSDWQDVAKQEVESGYDDAMLSIERAEAEGFHYGLLSAYIILNGHEPDIDWIRSEA